MKVEVARETAGGTERLERVAVSELRTQHL